MSVRTLHRQSRLWSVTLVACGAFALAQWPVFVRLEAQAPAGAMRPCRITGQIRSGEVSLPGAAVTVREGEVVRAATSTNLDGTYTLNVAPGTYHLRIELSVFTTAERSITVVEPECTAVVDASLVLASRAPGATLASLPSVAPAGLNGPAPVGPSGRGGRGGRAGGPVRFQSLAVEQSATANAAADPAMATISAGFDDDPAARLLPPGFSSGAVGEAVTVSGSMVQLDRNMLNDRQDALGRGEFGLGEGLPFSGPNQGGIGGQTGGGDPGVGGRGGLGGFGGRGRGGASRVQVNATYGLGGSMFDSPPYALRGEAREKREYLQQNLSTTVGGPLKIPGIYDGTNRTSFNFSYSAARNESLFDQYATVPNDAYRSGDFSTSAAPITDPLTGQPFEGNRIPVARIDAAALSLLRFIPHANLSGDTRNFHVSDTSQSTTDTFSVRLTHTLTQPQAGRGGRGGGRGGAPAGRAGGPPAAGAPAGQQVAPIQGRGGRGAFQPPLNVTLNATVNFRRNDGDRTNVYPLLAGTTRGSTVSVPVAVNIRAGRSMHAIGGSISRTTSSTRNSFAFVENIAAQAGIAGVAADPFDWGVPSLSFGTFTAVRDTAPSRRSDRSWQVSYGLTRPSGTHTWRLGGSFQQQVNRTQSDSNARGTFTFTGIYTANGLSTTRGSGQDFADFLLGLPQQATRQYNTTPDNISTPIAIRGRQFGLYLQDDWRWKARWTINYGLQYDFTAPFTETGGQMVNLDAAPDFSAVVPVLPGAAGPYSGVYEAGLVNSDWNNLAPRVGVAWRANNQTVVRFGYGLSYNSGSYSTIARNLYQQPPFFLTATSVGTLADPLALTDAFANITQDTVTNNYGIQKDYVLGLIHQWTADYSRNVFSTWSAGATYIGTRGSSLDLLRAPNRGAGGLRIDGVQSFTWQSSEGKSHMNGISLRLQKRQSRGVSGSMAYTWSRSRDNTTATGGSATVAQDDLDLDAEWALSNFDRRHQFAGSANVELPWGRNRRWLSQGGPLATVVGDWSVSTNLSVQSGTPLTARCSSCAANVAQGVVGTLRANYTGAPISIDDPSIDQYFNTSAFSIPLSGTFGNSSRNMIVGPGSRQLNAQFTRDVALGGTRNVSINVNASNLLNLVNFASVDANVNSPTFGQVMAVSGRRSVRVNLRFRF